MKSHLFILTTGLLVLNVQAQNQLTQARKQQLRSAGQRDESSPMKGANANMLKQQLAGWPARPLLGAQMMISQYGMPQEITSEKLVWHKQGPFKRITVTKKEDHHDFPKPHMDFVEHTIDYKLDAEKVDSLTQFDGSATFDRTRGELSARCDLEGHNILTLNLSNDLLTGKKDVESARKAFGDIVVEDALGKNPPYVMKLQFEPHTSMASFADMPTLPGSPMRPDAGGKIKMGKNGESDGETLGFIGAVDDNEIIAAMVASKKKINPEVMNYAKMLHASHGQNLKETLELGQKIGITPLETSAVDALRVKGAGELAAFAALDGEQFSNAFIAAMIKGHIEALTLIDTQLMAKASHEALKKHLTATRHHIAEHLDAAKRLKPENVGGAPQSVQGQNQSSKGALERSKANP